MLLPDCLLAASNRFRDLGPREIGSSSAKDRHVFCIAEQRLQTTDCLKNDERVDRCSSEDELQLG